MKTIITILMLAISLTANAFEWPNGKKSAISITADDGWEDELTQAQILDEYGLKGTFYLTARGLGMMVEYNKAAWRNVYLRGHEIGNHSYYHKGDLSTSTVQEVMSDIGAMEFWLYKNIFDEQYIDHTYSYPTGNYVIGTNSTTGQRKIGTCLFSAGLSNAVTGARISSRTNGNNNPSELHKRRFYITGLSMRGSDQEQIDAAKKAINEGLLKGEWTVLIFHELGDGTGGQLKISVQAYEQIIDYIKQVSDRAWVDTVVNVKNHVMKNTKDEYWDCQLPL
jgi:peptidoglycan/xylan/chitin deacetylase (PgdA/CDA1 family)